MLKSETAILLGLCATFDRRTIGTADVEAWTAVLGDLTFEACRAAVIDYYAESREWIMPSDVRSGALQRGVTFTPKTPALPDADPDEVADWLEALRNGRTVELEDGPGIEAARLSSVLKSVKDSA